MANETEEISWSYHDKQPCMGIRFKTFNDREYPANSEELVIIDTGNTAEIILPLQIYNQLDLKLWEEPEPEIFVLANGDEVEMFVSKGYILIPKLGSEPYEVNFYRPKSEDEDGNEILLGIEFINKFKLTLDGPNQELYLLRDN